MNFFYQSLAAAAGISHVSAGMKINLKVDLLLAHDGSGGKLIQAWEKAGRRKVFNGQKVVITLDHQFPAPTAGARALSICGRRRTPASRRICRRSSAR